MLCDCVFLENPKLIPKTSKSINCITSVFFLKHQYLLQMPKLRKIHPLWRVILLVACLLSAQVYKVTSLDLGNQSLRTDIEKYRYKNWSNSAIKNLSIPFITLYDALDFLLQMKETGSKYEAINNTRSAMAHIINIWSDSLYSFICEGHLQQ